MSSSRITKFTAFLLVALCIPAFAAAEIFVQKYEHNAFFSIPQEETFICGCGMNIDHFTLENHGDLAATFQLYLQTDKDWITLPNNRVYLEAGSQSDVSVIANPPCGTQESTTYTVHAVSQYGRFKVADRTLHTTTCQPILFEIEGDRIIQPCESANHILTITNTANYPEVYTVRADATLSESELHLNPGQTAQIFTDKQFACDLYGDFIIPVSVHAQKTGVTHEQDLPVTITWDYDFALEAQGASVCSQAVVTEEVIITNNAQTPNTYQLNIQNIPFASLNKQAVSLGPYESATVQVTINPQDNQIGSWDGQVVATAQHGDKQESVDVHFDIRKCFEHNVQVIPESNSVCAGTTNFTVQIQNRGEFTEEYHLALTSEVFAYLNTPSVTLRPGEHADVLLTVSAPDINSEFNVNVQVASQSVGVIASIDIPIETQTHYSCTEITPNNLEHEVFIEQSHVIPVIVENKGREAAIFSAHVDMTDFFALGEQEFFLAPGEQRVIHVLTQQELQPGNYVVWLDFESHRAQYRYDLKFNIKEKGFFDELKEQLVFGPFGKINWCLLITIILAIIAIVALITLLFVIAGSITLKRSLWSEKHKQELGVVFGVLFIVCLIAALAASYKPVPTQHEDLIGSNIDELFLEIPQGTVLELNIAQFFADPDNDELTFSASQSQHLRVKVEDNIAFIKPDVDFAGTDRIVFSAQDTGGLVADSPVMTVRVAPKKHVSFVQYVTHFCDMINWALLAAIFFILLLAILYVDPQPVEPIYNMETGQVVISDKETTQVLPVPVEEKPQPIVHGDVIQGDKVTIIQEVHTLQDVNGVGPALEKKLHAAGIMTIENLASAPLEELTQTAKLPQWRAEKVQRIAKNMLRNK